MSGNTLDVIKENLPNSLRDELTESEVATKVGGSYGEEAGRQVGQEVGAEMEQRFRSRLDDGANIGRAVRDSLKALPGIILHALREGASPGSVISTLKSQLKNEVGSLLTETGDEPSEETAGTEETAETEGTAETEEGVAAAVSDAATEAADTATDAAESATDAVTDTATEDDDEAAEAADSTTEAAQSIPGLPDSVDQLRRETIRDLLEVMSYRDLQSTAKEVGVKANQSHEEIVDEIIEQFAGEPEDDTEPEPET